MTVLSFGETVLGKNCLFFNCDLVQCPRRRGRLVCAPKKRADGLYDTGQVFAAKRMKWPGAVVVLIFCPKQEESSGSTKTFCSYDYSLES